MKEQNTGEVDHLRELVEKIVEELDGKEWHSGTTDRIAALLREGGFRIREPIYECSGCQREESVCSADPCEAVKQDRNEEAVMETALREALQDDDADRRAREWERGY